MRSLSLFVDRNTVVHRIDPITKLIYVFVSSISPFILPLLTVSSAFVILNLFLLSLGRVIKRVIPIISFIFLIIITIFIIQGMYYGGNQTELFTVFSLTFYREGLFYATKIAVRTVNILLTFSLLILTTKPSNLIESLVRRGLPPKLGYVMHSVLQIIPMMSGTASVIMDAQKSRGMETEGSLWVRMKAFIPLIGPLVMNSLMSTHERSIALEVRAFSADREKTFLHEEHIPGGMVYLRVFCLLVLIGIIVGRIII
ncbi:MAG: energy-coupling factor transporter transmembrane component T family protein [Halanaerobiaceae bacterium]